jgi:hypothetical protein
VSGPYMDGPDEELTAQAEAYYRRMLVQHADDRHTRQCRVCFKHRCPDWCNAYLRLTSAGIYPEGMAP